MSSENSTGFIKGVFATIATIAAITAIYEFVIKNQSPLPQLTPTSTAQQPTATATQAGTRTLSLTTTTSSAATPSPTSQLYAVFATIIQDEFEKAKRQDYGVLSLFADNAVVVDFQGQLQWIGQSQIRDRYWGNFDCCVLLANAFTVTAIKPYEHHQDKVTVKVTKRVRYQVRKTGVEEESRPTQELWYFQKVGGNWKIATFIYNIPD